MSIKGKTFDLQEVTSKDDGALYRFLVSNEDYLIDASAPTISGTNAITLNNGWMIVGGRVIKIDGNTVINVSPSITTGVGRLIAKINLANTSTETTFNQVEFIEEYAASESGFRTLTKNDINKTGTVYEAAVCNYTVTNGIISDLVPVMVSARPLDRKANAGKGVSSEANFNDITEAGWWWINPNVTTQNAPIERYGTLEVIRLNNINSGNILQRFTTYDKGIIYTRTYTNGQWYEWQVQASGRRTTTATTLNNVIDIGWYWINLANITNGPLTSGFGFLEVLKAGTTEQNLIQRFTQYGTGKMWTRAYVNDSWSQDWIDITGGYIKENEGYFYGIISNRIMPNTNLNNILTIGNYQCTTNSDAVTLNNCPTNQAFVMRVFSGNGRHTDISTNDKQGYLAQEITDVTGMRWIRALRRTSATSGVISPNGWVQVTPVIDVSSVSPVGTNVTGIVGGYIKEGRIVTVDLTLTTNAAATAAGLPLVSGVPVPLGNLNSYGAMLSCGEADTANVHKVMVSRDGNIVLVGVVATGKKLVISGSYITNAL